MKPGYRYFVFRELASIPLLLVGVFMLITMNVDSGNGPEFLEDRLFAGVGGDFHEYNFGVHGPYGVYPLRVKYYDDPAYAGPPVILVHGMGTSDAYLWRVKGTVDFFSGFIYGERRFVDTVGHAQGLADLGYDVVTYTYPDSRNRPLEYQAYDLMRVIKWTKERFITRRVILIGHSIGGLIVRYYLQSGQPDLPNYVLPREILRDYTWNRYYAVSDYEMKRLRYGGDVAAAVLIATPNLGNLKSDGLDRASPALYELKENSGFVTWLEEGRAQAQRKGYRRPPLAVFSGTAYEDYMGEAPLDFGDGIVSVASAVGPWDKDPCAAGNIFTFDLDHFELAMDGEVLARIYSFLREKEEEAKAKGDTN